MKNKENKYKIKNKYEDISVNCKLKEKINEDINYLKESDIESDFLENEMKFEYSSIDNFKSLSQKAEKNIKNKIEVLDNSIIQNYTEDKESAINKKVENLKKKLINDRKCEYIIENEIKVIRKEWPVLFGEEIKLIYVFMDLDSFYISIEMLEKGNLNKKPAAVGSMMIISAVNYRAREYGIKSGISGYKAMQMCPELVIIKSDIKKYKMYSKKVFEILKTFDKNMEIYGIDEGCLIFNAEGLKKGFNICKNYYKKKKNINEIEKNDISIYNKNDNIKNKDNSDKSLNKDIENETDIKFTIENVYKLVENIRNLVFKKTKLTISAGISVSRGLAKLFSKVNKPNGQFMLKDNFDEYLQKQPVENINGIGSVMTNLLQRVLNVKDIKSLRKNLERCVLIFNYKTVKNLVRMSYGLSKFDTIDGWRNFSEKKSISYSLTIKPTLDQKEICSHLLNLSHVVESKLNENSMAGKCIVLSLKYKNLKIVTKRKKLNKYIKTQFEIFEEIIYIVDKYFRNKNQNKWIFNDMIRLLGITITELVSVKNINSLLFYKNNIKVYNERKCIICERIFIYETQNVFEFHVNQCIDLIENKNKNQCINLIENKNKNQCIDLIENKNKNQCINLIENKNKNKKKTGTLFDYISK